VAIQIHCCHLLVIRAESAYKNHHCVTRRCAPATAVARRNVVVVMVASAALQNPADQQEPKPSHNEVLARYRLREISKSTISPL
jgi:hypothetical protein